MVKSKHGLLDFVVRDVRVLCVAVWVGATVFLVVALAPVLFDVLPTRELAGAVVGRVLTILNVGGLVVAGLLLATLRRGGRHRGGGGGTSMLRVEACALVVLACACAVNQFIIAPRIAELRARIGVSIDSLAADDAWRVQFGSLHGWSILILGGGLVAGVVALIVVARRENPVVR